MSWQPYARRPGSTVTGTLWQWEGVGDGQHAARTVLAWLPPSYDSESARRYPVIYFHDGQNVFDAAASGYGHEWQADETLSALALEELEAIAIGIPNGGERRFHEYSPVENPAVPYPGGGGADAYVAFLTDTVKPLVDRTLRTRPDPDSTVVVGSSMGGIVSLHALLRRPDVFGHAGILSPAFWTDLGFSERHTRQSPAPTGRVWLDIGGQEGDDPARQREYWDQAHAFADLLHEKGLGQRLGFVADPEAIHHESAWAARLPAALRFLLGTGPDAES